MFMPLKKFEPGEGRVYGIWQISEDERALASLDGVQPNGMAYVAPPVMTAMVESPADTPAAAAAASSSPAVSEIRTDLSIIRTASAAEVKAPASAPVSAQAPASTPAPSPKPARTETAERH